MSAVREPNPDRTCIERLSIVDRDGDRMEFDRLGDAEVLVWIKRQGGIVLDVTDGLALLSFLADALGVERYIPEAGGTSPARITPYRFQPCATCHVHKGSHAPLDGHEWVAE